MKSYKEYHLKNYAQTLLEKHPEIREKRKICNLKDIINDITDFDDLIKTNASSRIKQELRNEYNLYSYTQVIYTIIDYKKGDSIKWHCDDASMISYKTDFIDFNDNKIKVSEKKLLFYPNRIPKLSIIIYGSTYKDDFDGGIFEFSDGYVVKPVKNTCLIYDSRETHCVHKIRSGAIKSIIIKYY